MTINTSFHETGALNIFANPLMAQSAVKIKHNGRSQRPAKIDYTSLSNAELIKLCSQSAQHRAWEEFHQRFEKYIRMYIKKAWKGRLALNDTDSACAREVMRDLTQEVYIKLLEDDQQALKSFKGEGDISFLAYLSRIAVNIVAEHFRKQLAEKRKGHMLSMDMVLDDHCVEPGGSRVLAFNYLSSNPELDIINKIAQRELADLLGELLTGPNARRDQLIFKLHTVDGYSTQQIAEIEQFGLKMSSVESIIRRTRNRLREALQARGVL